MTQQTGAISAFELPDDFQVDSPDRHACWAALPAAVQSYITQLKATCSSHVQRIVELEAERASNKDRLGELQTVFGAAWGKRFCDAHQYKVTVMKLAHACELKRLQNEWDSHRSSSGTASRVYSICDLDSLLLENILWRLETPCPVGEKPTNTDAATVNKRLLDEGWHTRRILAQVCKLFEALSYTLPANQYASLLEAAHPPNAPPGFRCREFERLSLAPALEALVVYLPCRGSVSPDTFLEASAVGAAFEHADSLKELVLVLPLEPTPEARLQAFLADQEYTIPLPILSALPSCKNLTSLAVCGKRPIRLCPACTTALVDALISLPALQYVKLEGMSLPPAAFAARSLYSALRECKSLRSFTAWNSSLPCSWDSVVRLPLEAACLTCCSLQGGEGMEGPVSLHPLLKNLVLCRMPISREQQKQLARALLAAEQLEDLFFGFPPEPEPDHEALADALPGLKALRSLMLVQHMDGEVFENYAANLRACRHLEELVVGDTRISDSERWAELLASAVRSCAALKRLQLLGLQSASGEPLSLAALWKALPDCQRLEGVKVMDTQLQHADACTLCSVLGRCCALQALCFESCGLDREDINMLLRASNKAGIAFEAREAL